MFLTSLAPADPHLDICASDSVKYLLTGDIHQMRTQVALMQQHKIRTGQCGKIPGFYTLDAYIEGLGVLYAEHPDGWWNYQNDYLKHGICTQREYGDHFRLHA